MKTLLAILCSLLFMISCEPYEPVVMKGNEPGKKEVKGEQEIQTLKYISSFADGANYILYFASDSINFEPLYLGSEKYTGKIRIPDITPLDLWFVTVPATQDSVWLEVGCISVATVSRIRMVMNR